jgi:aspartate kinase
MIMAVIVQKYGGTSLGTLERITNVAQLIARSYNSGDQLIVVVSAMAGETNRLLNMAHEIVLNSGDINKRELDVIAATGEQVTMALLGLALKQFGVKVKSYCGWQVPICTTDDFTSARIKYIETNKITYDLNDGAVVIVAGFQGVTEGGSITTLGRGGSDTSAVALAVALKAHECQIYTDVNGVYTADPNKVAIATRIRQMDGACMLEAASLGTKVLHVRSCELGYRYKVNIRVYLHLLH